MLCEPAHNLSCHVKIVFFTVYFVQAFAAATLIAHGRGNATLLLAATRAMNNALAELVFGQPADSQGCAQKHCNFYTMPLMLAMDLLRGRVSDDVVANWDFLARSVDPLKAYRSWPRANGNWALIAATGEFLRYKAGLRPTLDDVVQQLKFQFQPHEWTANGQYQDHSGCNGKCNPIPYDHYTRSYISVLLNKHYDGPLAEELWFFPCSTRSKY